jgi:hypothetical protein
MAEHKIQNKYSLKNKIIFKMAKLNGWHHYGKVLRQQNEKETIKENREKQLEIILKEDKNNGYAEISGKSISRVMVFEHWKLILKFIYNIYRGKIQIDNVKIASLREIINSRRYGITNLHEYLDEDGYYNVISQNSHAEVIFNDVWYFLTFNSHLNSSGQLVYELSVNFKVDSVPDKRILQELLSLAYNHCTDFKGSVFEMVIDSEIARDEDFRLIKKDIAATTLDEVFLNDDIKQDLRRFIFTFQNFEELKLNNRFILSGRPGVGKTEAVRAVLNECKDYGTVIIANDIGRYIGKVFNAAGIFKKVILCLDDVDLLVKSRTESYRDEVLAEFLAALDGIVQNNIFILATTNDKMILDKAAARPGRFNQIIDFPNLDRKYYLPLIEQRTTDENIIELFDEEVIDLFEVNNATGAFIVNLLSQISVMKKMDENFGTRDLMNYIKRNHQGFYKKAEDRRKSLGFVNAV